MNAGKLLKYLLAGALAWVVLSTVVSVVFTALALLWSLLVAAASVLVLAVVVYGLYSLYQSVSGRDSRTRTRTRTQTRTQRSRRDEHATGTSEERLDDPSAAEGSVERLKREYAEGKLSEREFERRLETELSDGDDLDRELQ